MRTLAINALSAILLFTLAAPQTAAQQSAAPRVVVSPDRADGLYQSGEKVRFTAKVTVGAEAVTKGEVTFRFVASDNQVLAEQKQTLGDGGTQAEFTREVPSFVVCVVEYVTADGKSYFGRAGAGFDAEKIEPAVKLPEDFDAFWDEARAELAKKPLDLKVTPFPQWSTPNVDAFKLSVANVYDTRAYAYLLVPKHRPAPHPVLITVPGAGSGRNQPMAIRRAEMGAMVLECSVHAYDIAPFDGEPVDLKKVYTSNYSREGRPNKKEYFFYRSVLGIDRMVNYVATRSDADRKHVVISGGSQGGGLSLVLGGFNEHITAVSSGIPGMCDHNAYQLGRGTSWPALIPGEVRGKGNAAEQEYVEFAAYFDAVNFARRIKCPVVITVGLIDATCKAENVFAAYNVIPGPKRMFPGPQSGHAASAEFAKFGPQWITGQLGLD